MNIYNSTPERYDCSYPKAVLKELSKYETRYEFGLMHVSRPETPKTKNKRCLWVLGDNQGLITKESTDCNIIFKNHCDNNAIPLPLGHSDNFELFNTEPISIRPVDYCFIGTCRSKIREYIAYELERHSKNNQNCILDFSGRQCETDNYSKILHSSKICVVMPGEFSLESSAYFEAVAAGCIVICPKYPDFWYLKNRFEFRIPDWKLVGELIQRILEIPDNELDAVGNTTLEYYNSFINPVAMAYHIKNFIERNDV